MYRNVCAVQVLSNIETANYADFSFQVALLVRVNFYFWTQVLSVAALLNNFYGKLYIKKSIYWTYWTY